MRDPFRRKVSDSDIQAATAKVGKLAPGKSKIPSPWPLADPMPDITNLDFRDVQPATVVLSGLLASDTNLKRPNLLWHVANPKKSKNPSRFTKRPIVLDAPQGQVIVDGHHRLAAQQMLGKTSVKVDLVPYNA